MPETRVYENVYQDGELIESLSTEVSDEQLYQESLTQEFNDIHVAAINAYKNWGSLTMAQKDTILKNLVKFELWKENWLKLGTLEK